VSPRTEPKRTRFSSSTPREAKNPPRVLQHIRFVVGIPTEVSNGTKPATTSFFAEWLASLLLFHRAGSLPCPPRQAMYFADLRGAGRTISAALRLLKSSSNAVVGQFSHKLLSFNDLSLGVRTRGLTGEVSGRNMPPHGSRLRCVVPRPEWQVVASRTPDDERGGLRSLSASGQRGGAVLCGFARGPFPDHSFQRIVDRYSAPGCSVRSGVIKTSRSLTLGFSALDNRGVGRCRWNLFGFSAAFSGGSCTRRQSWSVLLGFIPVAGAHILNTNAVEPEAA